MGKSVRNLFSHASNYRVHTDSAIFLTTLKRQDNFWYCRMSTTLHPSVFCPDPTPSPHPSLRHHATNCFSSIKSPPYTNKPTSTPTHTYWPFTIKLLLLSFSKNFIAALQYHPAHELPPFLRITLNNNTNTHTHSHISTLTAMNLRLAFFPL